MSQLLRLPQVNAGAQVSPNRPSGQYNDVTEDYIDPSDLAEGLNNSPPDAAGSVDILQRSTRVTKTRHLGSKHLSKIRTV